MGELPVETRLFINNEFVSGNGTQFNTVNPVNEEVIKSVDSANKADIDRAVAAATEAFRSWGKGNGCDRRDCLLRLASLVEKHRDQLAEIESLDNGKPKHVADSVDIKSATVTMQAGPISAAAKSSARLGTPTTPSRTLCMSPSVCAAASFRGISRC